MNMSYINPFELLNLSPINLSEVDGITINKAKRKLLAEIELSENEAILFKKQEVSKSNCIALIDDLDNKLKREFHFYVYQNPNFNNFLTSGDLTLFTQFKVESIYKDIDFLDFISPYFSERYDSLLLKTIKIGKLNNIRTILSVKPIVNDTYFEKCYKGTYAYLKDIDADIRKIAGQIENGESKYILNGFIELPKVVSEKTHVDILNMLPLYFQSLRNQLAQTIKHLAVILNNDPFSNYEYAVKIIEIAKTVNSDGLVAQTITKDSIVLQNNYTSVVKSKEEEMFHHYRAIIRNIEKLLLDIDRRVSPHINNNFDRISNAITSEIDISELNALPNKFNDIRNRIAEIIKNIAITICNEFRHAEPSRELIQFASTIKVDDSMKVKIQQEYDIIYNEHHITYLKLKHVSPWIIVAIIILAIIIGVYFTPSTSVNESSSSNASSSNSPTPNDYPQQTTSNSPSSETTTQAQPNPPQPTFTAISMSNGNITGCSNFKAKYDYNIDNKLIISVGNNTDAAVKLCKQSNSKCIRFVYINKNTTYIMKNIPEGKYYLKIAYGEDWGILDGEPYCNGKFTKNALYKKGSQILDYNLVQTSDGYEVPSFSLKLKVEYGDRTMNEFSTNRISSNEFTND